MNASVVQSGIVPQRLLKSEIADAIDHLTKLMARRAEEAFEAIETAQHNAVERLEAFVPQDRLLTLTEAAAYLGYQPRTLQAWASGKQPKIQFTLLGGEKRFRKAWLDAAVDNNSVQPRKVRL